MKAGRWSSGGTFTSFYLRDLCPQADSIRRLARSQPQERSCSVMCIFWWLGAFIPLSLVLPFSKRKGGVLKDPPRLQAGEVFPLSVGNRIMVAPGASPGRRPPLSVKFWHNPKCPVASVWNGGVHSCTGRATIIFTQSSDLAKLHAKYTL